MTPPARGEVAQAVECSRCNGEGRCINGVVVYWSTAGRHEQPCTCSCHDRTALLAALTEGGRG